MSIATYSDRVIRFETSEVDECIGQGVMRIRNIIQEVDCGRQQC